MGVGYACDNGSGCRIFAIDKEKCMNAVYDVRYLVVIAVYIVITFTIVTAVTKGRTIGKALVNIRLVRADSKKTDNKTADYEAENIEADTHRRVNVFRLMGRYFILYVLACHLLYMHIIFIMWHLRLMGGDSLSV